MQSIGITVYLRNGGSIPILVTLFVECASGSRRICDHADRDPRRCDAAGKKSNGIIPIKTAGVLPTRTEEPIVMSSGRVLFAGWSMNRNWAQSILPRLVEGMAKAVNNSVVEN
jgi:hypothetical protein